MVLEQLYPARWLQNKSPYAFIIGVSYSVVGILFAILVFPQSSGIAAIAFTSILILPTLNKLLTLEENQEARSTDFNLTRIFREHSDIFRIYLFLFIGIMFTFGVFSILLPSLASSKFFSAQVNVTGLTGLAIGGSLFQSILLNNLVVLLVAFVSSFVYGSGAVFIITWNASVWGVFFGLLAKTSATTSINPWMYFTLVMIAVAPHLIAEASAYFLTAISGGIISKATLREEFMSRTFVHIISDSLVIFGVSILVLILAAAIEVGITPSILNAFGL
jgi:uncharacterized membrane protein SpoIIM required for sporulation